MAAGRAVMLPGFEAEHRDTANLSAWYTPPDLAARVWEWAKAGGPHGSVLEPSAGDGALVKPIMRLPGACWRVQAVEIDHRRIDALSALRDRQTRLTVVSGDFLTLPFHVERFELAVCNPPYERGQTEAFAARAAELADRVVLIAQSSVLHGQARAETLWRWHDVTRGVWLAKRPSFGQDGQTAQRDFVVLELRKRQRPREAGESMACSWEWWH